MLTRKQGAEQRRALDRDIDRDLKAKTRTKVMELRARLRGHYSEKKARMKELAARCRTDRHALRDRLREVRARILRELRETAALERRTARDLWLLRRSEAKGSSTTAIERAQAELEAERHYQAELRRLESGNRARRAEHSKTKTRSERQGESDDEVRQNIPPDLAPLFERVKRAIKGSSLMSRSEAFLLYAEQHPHEVFEVVEEKTERLIRELEERHADVARTARSPVKTRIPPNTPRRKYSAEELAAVPF